MNEKMEKQLVGHMLYHKEHGYDAGRMRQGKKVWSLYERVIDWAKVKEIAD